ncbi:hypothetical protein [Sinomonas gamaensis]|uniref:hypothetical protein n=1 Tax=Sinomonas gamaensis TaxID=2565624 RepID=UPI001108AF67|nr:hypothetical protein [Sinomonas gamaensis]
MPGCCRPRGPRGPQLDQLFITSACVGLTERQQANEVHAGAIFVLDPGVTGRPPASFRDDASSAAAVE